MNGPREIWISLSLTRFDSPRLVWLLFQLFIVAITRHLQTLVDAKPNQSFVYNYAMIEQNCEVNTMSMSIRRCEIVDGTYSIPA